MNDDRYILALEAREWFKQGNELQYQTPFARELRIQAQKLDRMVMDSLQSFADLFPPRGQYATLRDLMLGDQRRSIKKLRKKQGRQNHAIDRQYKKLLGFAEKAMRKEIEHEQNAPMTPADVRVMMESTCGLFRSMAINKLNLMLAKKPHGQSQTS
jgi:hypothetical protein